MVNNTLLTIIILWHYIVDIIIIIISKVITDRPHRNDLHSNTCIEHQHLPNNNSFIYFIANVLNRQYLADIPR